MSRFVRDGSSCCGFILSGFWFVGAVLEAEAVIAGLDDVAMMGQAVEQRCGHLGIPEHLIIPLISIGESLMFRLLTLIIRCLGTACG